MRLCTPQHRRRSAPTSSASDLELPPFDSSFSCEPNGTLFRVVGRVFDFARPSSRVAHLAPFLGAARRPAAPATPSDRHPDRLASAGRTVVSSAWCGVIATFSFRPGAGPGPASGSLQGKPPRDSAVSRRPPPSAGRGRYYSNRLGRPKLTGAVPRRLGGVSKKVCGSEVGLYANESLFFFPIQNSFSEIQSVHQNLPSRVRVPSEVSGSVRGRCERPRPGVRASLRRSGRLAARPRRALEGARGALPGRPAQNRRNRGVAASL